MNTVLSTKRCQFLITLNEDFGSWRALCFVMMAYYTLQHSVMFSCEILLSLTKLLELYYCSLSRKGLKTSILDRLVKCSSLLMPSKTPHTVTWQIRYFQINWVSKIIMKANRVVQFRIFTHLVQYDNLHKWKQPKAYKYNLKAKQYIYIYGYIQTILTISPISFHQLVQSVFKRKDNPCQSE